MYLTWNGVKFLSKKNIDFKSDILAYRLITVPAAPAFVENKNNEFYYQAIRNASFNIIDSSFFALLCKLTGKWVYKYSGYRLISDMLKYLKENRLKIFIVGPRQQENEKILELFREATLLNPNDLNFYEAPFYPKNCFLEDSVLLDKINSFQPGIIIISIAGGKQEILGNFLNRNISFHSTILCTGAAISFFTGSQAKISPTIDKFYLGWLARIISNPKIYFPRYFNAIKFFSEFFRYKTIIIK